MSDTITRGIRVQVKSAYIPERSRRQGQPYLFAYRVRISNDGAETVRLVGREWIITDADGQLERVSGPGVVGEQPILGSGESFEYTSVCSLRTPIGSMHGSYQLVSMRGHHFDAVIAPVSLAVPIALR